jgi:hypothetical protein
MPQTLVDLTDRHVVVTGGAGFVGSWVCTGEALADLAGGRALR